MAEKGASVMITGRDETRGASIVFKAPFFLVAALAPKIAPRGGGSIINISTMVARYGQLEWLRTAPRGRRSSCSPRHGPPNTGRRTCG
jgi:NAD(P)-dependent dehydrogenase (short-subunit alcohol dehydrogenase family)